MAWENYGWVWNILGVQGSEYVVLMLLANEANAKGITSNLRVDKIMRRCNLSRRAVFRYLARLEEKGFVKRKREWSEYGDMDANTFTLDMKRYFPKGEYNESLAMWTRMVERLQPRVPGRVTEFDFRILKKVAEAYFQKNSKVLFLVTETDLYEEVMYRNLAAIKEAAVGEKLLIRRFEAFRKPYLK